MASYRLPQSGFALIELILALSISAFIAIYANQALVNQSQENIASGGGVYLQTVAQATDRYVLTNFNDLAGGVTDVPGVAVDLRPTIPELIALSRLPAGYPQITPTRQAVRIDIRRTNCPGANCQIIGTVCTTTGVTMGSPNVRYDLVTAMYESQNGRGAMSRYADPGNIVGPGINIANPVGNVPGVVCGTSFVDVGVFNRFLQINDPRDPNFQGGLTVTGATTLNGATAVNGATTVNNTLAVTGAATMGNNLTVTGNAMADRLTPTGQYASGAPCVAADEGSIARLTGQPGLVTCTLGAWRVFAFESTSGSACAPDGATARTSAGQTMVCVNGTFQAFDTLFRSGVVNAICTTPGATAIDTTSNNETLICRINLAGGSARWMRLRDVTTHLVMVSATEVTPGATVTKPNCNGATSQIPVGIIQLIPKAWGSPDGGQSFYASDNGASWLINLKDGASNNLLGAPLAKAIAQIYCYFP